VKGSIEGGKAYEFRDAKGRAQKNVIEISSLWLDRFCLRSLHKFLRLTPAGRGGDFKG